MEISTAPMINAWICKELESKTNFITLSDRAKLLQLYLTLFNRMDSVVHQALLSMGFPRQEYWSGLPFTSLRDLPNPGIKPMSLASLALAGGFFTTEPPGKPKYCTLHRLKIGCSKIQSPSPSLSEGKYS